MCTFATDSDDKYAIKIKIKPLGVPIYKVAGDA